MSTFEYVSRTQDKKRRSRRASILDVPNDTSKKSGNLLLLHFAHEVQKKKKEYWDGGQATWVECRFAVYHSKLSMWDPITDSSPPYSEYV